MKQVFIRQGQAAIDEVPVPQVEPGTVLVRVQNSCISTGTEMSGVRSTADPLWVRAIKDPSKILKAARMVSSKGLAHTRSVVEGQTLIGTPTGYSAAGYVVAVGEDVTEFRPGERVACAGAQYAHHAEVIRVPRNLVVHIPASVSFAHASSVALGSIAMQGVRRANPTLGEAFVVIGLGLLGQLTVQMLKANGCRVAGADLDPARVELARKFGMDAALIPGEGDILEQIARLTDGVGADGVIITAATPSSEVMSTAFKLCRRKGRVVLVGDVGLNLDRADFYQKELDFFISTSYGPGRYDDMYEEKGVDYPPAYVRWTENRNMSEYLRLLHENKVTLEPLPTRIFPVEQVNDAYESLKSETDRPLIAFLGYPPLRNVDEAQAIVANPRAQSAGQNQIKLALVGAGGFAKGMHLPNIKALPAYHLQAVMSHTAHNAAMTAKQYDANYSTTDYQQVLNDPGIDAVLLAPRHDLHAQMTLDALKAGKHVLVEKPLALTRESLNMIEGFYRDFVGSAPPVLLTGFNRRFSPFAIRIQELVHSRTNPMILNYRMNAGYIPLDHWTHGDEGGGRNRGEACHIYDLFTYLTNSKVTGIQAQTITPATGYYSNRDNFVTTMTFEDGSVATLTYTALGSKDYPKEQMEVFVDGKVLFLDDYKALRVSGLPAAKGIETRAPDKGHKTELEAFASVIQGGGDWPILLWQQVQATHIALEVEDLLGN